MSLPISLKNLTQLDVYFNNTHWGTLAQSTDKNIYFQYTPQALASKLQISPFCLPLKPSLQGPFAEHQFALPGVIYDCLPDAWGLMLLNRAFKKAGISAQTTALQKLLLTQNNRLGALEFKNQAVNIEKIFDHPPSTAIDLGSIDKNNCLVFSDSASKESVMTLLGYSGSVGGARPKTMLHLTGDKIFTQPQSDSSPWIFKFSSPQDTQESTAIEQLYMILAKECGLNVQPSKYVDLGQSRGCFATKRFDIDDKANAIHTHTLSGMLDLNFKIPAIFDYKDYLKLTTVLTKDISQSASALNHCIFNVLFSNKDDHYKNFSFLMDENGHWRLSPCYDLTFSPGPNFEHHMSINSKTRSIKDSDFLAVASSGSVSTATAKSAIQKISDVAAQFSQIAAEQDLPIKKSTISAINKVITKNLAMLNTSTAKAKPKKP